MKDQQIKRLLDSGRKSRNQGGSVDAHVDASGIAIPRSGDREAPFTKLNPFVTVAEPYWSTEPLPDADASYINGPLIDVSQWRTLVIYVTCDGQLSLLPQASPNINTPLVPVGAINPTMTAITVPSTTDAYASRTMYGTELRNPAATEFHGTLTFDVTMYSVFNFRAAEVAPGEVPSVVTLAYALSM